MTRLRLDFCDFWPGFVKTQNYFYDLLSTRFQIELTDNPDFIIYADFGKDHRRHTCPRIFFSGEKTAPNFRQCDYALTSHYFDDPRHLRLPLYAWSQLDVLIKSPDYAEKVLAEQRKFCSFVVSNKRNKERIRFFESLSARRKVDSGGRLLNNIGGPVADKNIFLQSYRLNIAFENLSQIGYTTEKIVQPMQMGCIPIYWGNPRINEEFNPKSFVNVHDFPNQEAVIERVLEIDSNPDLYLQCLREPWFYNNQPNKFCDKQRTLNFFEKIFSTKIKPVGARRSFLTPFVQKLRSLR